MAEDLPIVVIGGRGLGEEVRDAIETSGRRFRGFLDDESSSALGPATPEALPDDVATIIAVGDPLVRFGLANRFAEACTWTSVIHPSAVVSARCSIGDGCYIGPMAYVGPLALLGDHVVVNVHAEVGHHATVGDFSTLSPLAALNGAVVLGEGTFLGTSATVEPEISIGPWCRVSATSHVKADADEGMLLHGNPATGRKLFKNPRNTIDLRGPRAPAMDQGP